MKSHSGLELTAASSALLVLVGLQMESYTGFVAAISVLCTGVRVEKVVSSILLLLLPAEYLYAVV